MHYSGITMKLFPFMMLFIPAMTAAQPWEQVYPDYPTDDLWSFVHWNGDTVFATGDNWTLMRSTDAGVTWINMFTKNKWYNIVRCVVNKNGVYFLPMASGYALADFSDSTSVFLYKYDPYKNDTIRINVPILPATHEHRAYSYFDISAGTDCIVVLQETTSLSLHFSTNDGVTWETKLLPDSLSTQYGNGQIFFRDRMHGVLLSRTASLNRHVFITSDGGVTWVEFPGISFDGSYTKPVCYKLPGGWVNDSTLLFVKDGSIPALSTDYGLTWTYKAMVPTIIRYISMTESGRIYVVGESGSAFRSDNDGNSFYQIKDALSLGYSGQINYTGLMVNDTIFLTGGMWGDIFRTEDAGMTWDPIRFQDLYEMRDLHFFNSNDGAMVANDLKVNSSWYCRSTDGGKSWQRRYNLYELGYATVLNASPDILYAFRMSKMLNDTVIYVSSNGGESWKSSYIISASDTPTPRYPPRSSSRRGRPDYAWVFSDGGVMHTTNRGTTWNLYPQVLTLAGEERPMNMDMRDSTSGWLLFEKYLLRTLDDGRTWQVALQLPDSFQYPFGNLNVLSHSTVYLSAEYYSYGDGVNTYLFWSIDGGTTWSVYRAATNSPPSITIDESLHGVGMGLGYVGKFTNYQFLYRTEDGWRTSILSWVLNNHRPGQVFLMNNTTGWFTTERALFRTINGGVNAVQTVPAKRSDITIFASYPNPVSPGSALSLDLELAGVQEQRISLTLYDTMGRKITTLREGAVAPGRTSVSFPTTGLSPGLYFVRLVTERGTVVRKVVVR